MSRTKLIAFLLMVASLGAVLFSLEQAAGIIVFARMGIRPLRYPTGDLHLGFMASMILLILLPFAATPGAAGFLLWLIAVRRRALERMREVLSWRDQEFVLQGYFDNLMLLIAKSNSDEELLGDPHKGVEDLGLARWDRWRWVLAASGDQGELPILPYRGASAEPSRISERGARILSSILSLFGVICFIFAVLYAATLSSTDLIRIAGAKPGPDGALLAASGCAIPGASAMLAAVGIVWLLRRERRHKAEEERWRDRSREVLLDGCIRRLIRLAGLDLDVHPVGLRLRRLSRALILDALSELDGRRKARLLLALHANGLHPDLRGADFRGAVLPEGDLADANLMGIDFSQSALSGSCMTRADLRSCRFVGADLRNMDLESADLRNCDLRNAQLHNSKLRKADLRNIDLRGANLWQADLAGADLRGSFVSFEQLRPAASIDGTSLPFKPPRSHLYAV